MSDITKPKFPQSWFNANFDPHGFDEIRDKVKAVINQAKNYDDLRYSLKRVPQCQGVEPADDHYLENLDFDSEYRTDEEDSCDFLVLLCCAELDRSRMETKSDCVEVCFVVVWNDVKKLGWIDTVSLLTSDNPYGIHEPLCYFHPESHEILAWAYDTE